MTEDLAVEQVEGDKQRGRPVMLVVMRHRLGAALFQRQRTSQRVLRYALQPQVQVAQTPACHRYRGKDHLLGRVLVVQPMPGRPTN